MGCIVILTKDQAIYIWDAYCIFGLLSGSAMAYYLSGSVSRTEKNMSDEIINRDIN